MLAYILHVFCGYYFNTTTHVYTFAYASTLGQQIGAWYNLIKINVYPSSDLCLLVTEYDALSHLQNTRISNICFGIL